MMLIDSDISAEAVRARVLDEAGRIKDLPAGEWRKFPWEQVRLFMHQYPIYVLPTTELLDKLDELIGDLDAIEIGAGSGNIGRHLDIRMTDSYQQARQDMQFIYGLTKQPTIKYPSDVLKMDALTAVRRFRPNCVLGCYVTHKWREGMETGNMYGVDFGRLLQSVKRLILVGNKRIHAENPIMAVPHEEISLGEDIITRNEDRSADRIFVWDNQ